MTSGTGWASAGNDVENDETKGMCIRCGDPLDRHPDADMTLEQIEQEIQRAEAEQMAMHLRGERGLMAEAVRREVRLRCVGQRAHGERLP